MKVWVRLSSFRYVINVVEPIPGWDDHDDWEEVEINDEELRQYFESLEIVNALEAKVGLEVMSRYSGF